jgi:hypothetical protein
MYEIAIHKVFVNVSIGRTRDSQEEKWLSIS